MKDGWKMTGIKIRHDRWPNKAIVVMDNIKIAGFSDSVERILYMGNYDARRFIVGPVDILILLMVVVVAELSYFGGRALDRKELHVMAHFGQRTSQVLDHDFNTIKTPWI